jgi:hypothetical protein
VLGGIFLVHWNGGSSSLDENAKQSIQMISLDAHAEALALLEARTTATTKADSSAVLRNDNKRTGATARQKRILRLRRRMTTKMQQPQQQLRG